MPRKKGRIREARKKRALERAEQHAMATPGATSTDHAHTSETPLTSVSPERDAQLRALVATRESLKKTGRSYSPAPLINADDTAEHFDWWDYYANEGDGAGATALAVVPPPGLGIPAARTDALALAAAATSHIPVPAPHESIAAPQGTGE